MDIRSHDKADASTGGDCGELGHWSSVSGEVAVTEKAKSGHPRRRCGSVNNTRQQRLSHLSCHARPNKPLTDHHRLRLPASRQPHQHRTLHSGLSNICYHFHSSEYSTCVPSSRMSTPSVSELAQLEYTQSRLTSIPFYHHREAQG